MRQITSLLKIQAFRINSVDLKLNPLNLLLIYYLVGYMAARIDTTCTEACLQKI